MPVQITIRGVPEEVRDALVAKAALKQQSIQEFLSNEPERIAARPSPETVLRNVRRRKEAARSPVPSSEILAARDADRA